MTVAEQLRMEGRQEGIEQGRLSLLRDMTLNMLNNGMNLEQISRTTGIDKEQLRKVCK